MTEKRRKIPFGHERKTSLDVPGHGLYKQPNLSHSTPAIGSYPLRKKQSKSIFSIFQDKDMDRERKVGSLMRAITGRKSFLQFGTKKAITETEDDRYKPIDFSSMQQSTVREWDSLSVDELRRPSLELLSLTLGRKSRKSLSEVQKDLSAPRDVNINTDIPEAEPSAILTSAPPLMRSKIPPPVTSIPSNPELVHNEGPETCHRNISVSPIKPSSIVAPQTFFPIDLENPIEIEENFYDMKKWLMEKENTVAEAVAVQVATTPEEIKSLSSSRSSSITSNPKLFSLEWSKPVHTDEDLLGMKKWLNEEEEVKEQSVPITLIRRGSIKRSQYSDSYIAISASDAEKSDTLETIDETTEILAETLEATKVDDVAFDAPQVPEKESIAVISTVRKPKLEESVLPNHPVPEPIFLNKDPNEPDVWPIVETLSHEPDPIIYKPQKVQPYITTPVNRLTLVTAPGRKKVKHNSWSWFPRLKLFSKKGKQTFEENESSCDYPSMQYPPNRLAPDQEKDVYSLSHTKLSQPGRPLLQQVQITNLMLYILSVHSAVTIHGRGPQRKQRKQKRKKRQPLIEPTLTEKPKRGSSSDSDSDDDDNEVKNIKARKSKVPAVKLVQLPVANDEGDEEDDIPLAMLQKNVRSESL